MNRRETSWFSNRLNRDMHILVYGDGGYPLLVFQTQNSKCGNYEDFGMIDTLADYIDGGRIQVFCVDSVDEDSWSNESGDKAWRAWYQESYYHYIIEEVLPFIHGENHSDRRPIATGCSMGATHAAIVCLRRPDLFEGMIALSGALFSLKAQIAYKLQDIAYQTDDLISFRQSLVQDMLGKVQVLDRDNFAVRQHIKYVEMYSNPDNYQALTYENTLMMEQELAPLVQPDADDPKALRFDALMYGIELAYLAGKKYSRARSDLMKKVSAVASVANIPEIIAQQELIQKILTTDYVENAGINEFEHIRENIRDLIKYIPISHIKYETNFDDEILSMEWNDADLENDDLKNYKAKAEFYVRQHQDQAVIAKLKGNVPLTESDVHELERILWSEIGTKEDYEREIGSIPLGEFVRGIVGMDMAAAKAAFADYLESSQLDSRQIYFVNQIVEYIVHNGIMKDMSVLQEPPFTDQGSVVDIFSNITVWQSIKKVIDQVNANALTA